MDLMTIGKLIINLCRRRRIFRIIVLGKGRIDSGGII